MGAAARFLMLLSAPLPRLYPRPSALRLRSLAHLSTCAARDRLSIALGNPRRHRPGFAIRAAAEQIHNQAADKPHSVGPAAPQHPWPEWSKLVDYLATRSPDRSSSIGAGSDDDDSFAVHEDLPKEFVRAAGAFLALARDRPDALRLLPKKDIEVLVENGSPFLFKNGMNSVRRMISFLSSQESDIPISERAHTVDVVRYLLSYAYNPLHISSVVDPQTKEFLEASIRNLLSELVNVSEISQGSNIIDSPPSQSPVRHDQFSRPARQNIEMKRGDWTCPKCSFLNFARNMRCLECNEGRPKRQLTGGEWECPQCDFFNYGRNMSCLRCDCKRPGGIPLDAPSGVRIEQNEKSSLQSSISQSLDRILGRSPPTSGTNQHSAGGHTESRGRFNSVEYGQSMANQRRDPGYVPFVPFPPDMFRKSQETNSETQKSSEEDLVADKASQFNGSSGGAESDDTLPPERMKNPNESKNDVEQSDKTERWFTKVSELQGSADLASAISGEDFPDIMPMRKGENRFVVSKKKDRSLTSPHYKRRMAMEQASNSNFVPFVPFPPDYFAKKDKQPEAGSPVESAAEASPLLKTHEARPEMLNESKSIVSDGISAGDISQPLEIAHTNSNNYSTGFFQKSSNDFINGGAAGSPDRFSYNSSNNKRESQNDRVSPGSTFNGASVAGNSCQQPNNSRDMRDNGSRGFTGKSLEGSAVTEPDPLDMSEEAKAQRWFKRVAQIKDISELANIPDEDFPEIMPMRKGVNRFVVSKRKTPLERRLTSQQYRRNLPIVSSEPEKKANSE